MKTNNKIIFLIAPPRSLSTAFLRMMSARNDFTLINEPACSVFNETHYPDSKLFYSDQACHSYREVKEKIVMAAKRNPVFVKEMCFAFEEFITAEPALLKDTHIHYVFLLRDPHACLISYYKKLPSELLDHLMIDFPTLTGFRSLYQVFKTVKKEAINSPCVVRAHDLYTNKVQAVKAFCDHTQIPYINEALNWDNLGEAFTGTNEWQEIKKKEFTHHWHREAILSNHFHQPTLYEVDAQGHPTFAEIPVDEHRKKCHAVYQENRKYYDLINLIA